MLCVMVILPTDGVGSQCIYIFVYIAYMYVFHAEADDVEESARSFMITREGRPFILPQR